jgi:hypothetical protein
MYPCTWTGTGFDKIQRGSWPQLNILKIIGLVHRRGSSRNDTGAAAPYSTSNKNFTDDDIGAIDGLKNLSDLVEVVRISLSKPRL